MAHPKRESNNITKGLADRLDELMRNERDRTGLSQNEICKRIGVPSSSYSEWAADITTPSVSLIVKVANYFDCSVDYVLGLTTTRAKDVEVDVAVQNTGLSEDALWRLRCLKDEADPDYLFVMNTLIASDSMDTIVREICEVRRIQQSFANKAREDIYELEEIQDEAIDLAKKVLEDAGVIGYKILSRGEILDHHFRKLEDYFNFMLQVSLFHDDGELYAGK